MSSEAATHTPVGLHALPELERTPHDGVTTKGRACKGRRGYDPIKRQKLHLVRDATVHETGAHPGIWFVKNTQRVFLTRRSTSGRL